MFLNIQLEIQEVKKNIWHHDRDILQYKSFPNGGIAQLVERLNGIQEASGSTPLISTKTNIRARLAPFLRVSDFGHLRFGKLPRPRTWKCTNHTLLFVLDP